MKFEKKDIFTIPNILTYLRLLAVPFFIWLMVDSSIKYNVWIALGLFVIAELTDLVDGFIARKFNMVSDIGKVLDPLADKLLQVSTVICLVIIGRVHWAFAAIIFAKELYMALGSFVVLKLAGSKVTVQANVWGKAASALFTAGIVLAFFHIEKLKNLYYIDWAVLGVACAFAIWAAYVYTAKMVKEVLSARKQMKEAAEIDKTSEPENSSENSDKE